MLGGGGGVRGGVDCGLSRKGYNSRKFTPIV